MHNFLRMGDLTINLITSLKDEAPYILEWVAHHKAVGFDRIGVLYHDCTDGSDLLVRALARAGWIEAYPFEVDPIKGPQHSGYASIHSHDIVQNADWLAVFDLDEFLNIHIDDGSVQSLIKRQEQDVDILSINWKVFAQDDIEDRDITRWVTEDFQCAHILWRKNRDVKSFTKAPKRFRELHNHHPHRFKEKGDPIVANMAGEKWVPERRDGREALWRVLRHLPQHRVSHQYAQLNHYITKSFPEYVLKCCRGAGFGKDAFYDWQRYFKWNDGSTAADLTISRYNKRAHQIADEMRKSPEVEAIQSQIIENSRERMAVAHDALERYGDTLPESFETMVIDVKRKLKNFDYTLAET